LVYKRIRCLRTSSERVLESIFARALIKMHRKASDTSIAGNGEPTNAKVSANATITMMICTLGSGSRESEMGRANIFTNEVNATMDSGLMTCGMGKGLSIRFIQLPSMRVHSKMIKSMEEENYI
jgi:hypothetical protein